MSLVRIAAVALVGAGLASCSVERRVERARAELAAEYRAMPDYGALPVRALSWRQAVGMMLAGNVEYRQAVAAAREARRQERGVFREMIPGANWGFYDSQPLFRARREWEGNGGRLDVNVLFNMPDMMRLPADKYARALAAYKAELDCRLKERELVSKLYRFFAEEAIEVRKREAEEGRWLPEEGERRRREEEQAGLGRARWSAFCELMNDYSARWQPLAETTPRVRAEDFRELLKEPGELTQRLMALELEASRLRRLGVALRYWPSTNVDFYSPTLFNMSGGQLGGFSEGMRDVRLNLNLYMQVDTRLDIWQEHLSAKEQHELCRAGLRRAMQQWREKMRLVAESWEQYREWREAMEAYVGFRRRQGVCDPEGMLSWHAEARELAGKMAEQEGKNAERVGALLMEYGLPEGTEYP